jgi:hypothetical protein
MIDAGLPIDTAGHVTHEVRYSCVDCDEFELTKSYRGAAGTESEEQFDRVESPDECPVCGGAVEREVVE